MEYQELVFRDEIIPALPADYHNRDFHLPFLFFFRILWKVCETTFFPSVIQQVQRYIHNKATKDKEDNALKNLSESNSNHSNNQNNRLDGNSIETSTPTWWNVYKYFLVYYMRSPPHQLSIDNWWFYFSLGYNFIRLLKVTHLGLQV